MQKRIYGVIGCPVHHSKSPDIYNYLFDKHGINALYISIELNEDNAADFLNRYASAMNLTAINATMPLKEVAANIAKELDSVSSLLGTVNTLDLTTGKGFTTDGKGLLLSMKFQDFDVSGKNVIVMGAGGAAKSIVYELSKSNPSGLTVFNRTVEKAQELAAKVGNGVIADTLSKIGEYIGDCDLLINCTSMGMTGKPDMDLSFMDNLNSNAFVYDIIYEPRETALLKKASSQDHKTSNGLDMLICQALYAFEIYTGISPSKKDRDDLLQMLS